MKRAYIIFIISLFIIAVMGCSKNENSENITNTSAKDITNLNDKHLNDDGNSKNIDSRESVTSSEAEETETNYMEELTDEEIKSASEAAEKYLQSTVYKTYTCFELAKNNSAAYEEGRHHAYKPGYIIVFEYTWDRSEENLGKMGYTITMVRDGMNDNWTVLSVGKSDTYPLGKEYYQ